MLYDMKKIDVIKTNVLIEITEVVDTKVGSIFIPPTAQGKDNPIFQGVVHKVGASCSEDIAKGDKVLFDITQSVNFDKVFAICPEEFILAKFKG